MFNTFSDQYKFPKFLHSYFSIGLYIVYMYSNAFGRRVYPKRLALNSLGIEPMTLALPAPYFTAWARKAVFYCHNFSNILIISHSAFLSVPSQTTDVETLPWTHSSHSYKQKEPKSRKKLRYLHYHEALTLFKVALDICWGFFIIWCRAVTVWDSFLPRWRSNKYRTKKATKPPHPRRKSRLTFDQERMQLVNECGN